MADHHDAMTVHLANRDVSFVAVSRAPLADIERFRQRMGWKFEWVSSAGNDFNKDFHVSFDAEDRVDGAVYYNYGMTRFPNTEAPGISVFCKDDAGEIFHTYSTFGRGVEVMMGTYHMLDLVPRGRAERDVPNKMEWVRHHDRYEPAPAAAACRDERLRRGPEREEHAVASVWPWLAVAGVGALHGLNPATGWLLVAASGLRSGDRRQAWRALLPIGVGHAASIALVAGAVAVGVALDRAVLQLGGRGAAARRRGDSSPAPRRLSPCELRRATPGWHCGRS